MIRFRTRKPFGGDEAVPEDAVAAEQRFLELVRARVAWQVEAASRLRGGVAQTPPNVLDIAVLERLLAANTGAARAAEWGAFLAELAFLTDADGRLPVTLERLVRVVFAELLEP